jgi:hypothetical protein
MGRGEDILADWRQASKYLICSCVYLPVSQGAKADCGIAELGRDRGVYRSKWGGCGWIKSRTGQRVQVRKYLCVCAKGEDLADRQASRKVNKNHWDGKTMLAGWSRTKDPR